MAKFSSASKNKRSHKVMSFSKSEIDAARQLLLLGYNNAQITQQKEEDLDRDDMMMMMIKNNIGTLCGCDKAEDILDFVANLCSTSSSSSSSNMAPAAQKVQDEDNHKFASGEEEEEEEEEEEDGYPPRRNKRFRSIQHVYNLTQPLPILSN